MAFGLLALWAAQGLTGGGTVAPGTRVADLRAELDDGSVYALGRRPDQVLVLSFWATWCAVCRREFPVLNGLASGAGDQLAVVGVAIDSLPLPTVSAKARGLGIRYPVAIDRTGLSGRFDVRAVPTTYVIAPDGEVVFGATGVVARQALEAAVARARSR